MNNYSDYYSYMNSYMTNQNDMLNSQSIPNYQNVPISYPNFDNNTFANNFMIPTGNNELLTPQEGLEKGNLFKNLYDPYKGYKPVGVSSKTEKGKLLNEILSYGFAMNDLGLYLDVYTNNSNYIGLYNEYRKIKENLVNQYEKMYGPLSLSSNTLENNNWVWINSPWPWEGEK